MSLPSPAHSVFRVLRETVTEFISDDCLRLAAALAYYTIFSLPPLLVIVITIAGAIWGREAAEGRVKREIQNMIGEKGAGQVQTMLQHAGQFEEDNRWAAALGVGVLLFGATGAFVQLQQSLNAIWGVRPDPKRGGVKNFFFKRLMSFGMVLSIAFLLLVALVISALLGAAGTGMENLLSEHLSVVLLRAANVVVSLVIITFLFAAMFKVLPDAEVRWREVWVGAAVTSALFVIGKSLIGLYIGNSNVGSAYGAAGSLAIILIWIYFAGAVLFLGAEFTQVWARHTGKEILPSEGAVQVVEEVRLVRDTGEETVKEKRKDQPV